MPCGEIWGKSYNHSFIINTDLLCYVVWVMLFLILVKLNMVAI